MVGNLHQIGRCPRPFGAFRNGDCDRLANEQYVGALKYVKLSPALGSTGGRFANGSYGRRSAFRAR